jgi:hypothetical protein
MKYKIVHDDRFLYAGENENEQEKQQEKEQEKEQKNPLLVQTDYSTDILQQVRQYKQRHPNTRIYILTPCFGGICHTNYVVSLMNTLEFFKEIDMKLVVEFCKNDSLVSRARNNLIAKALTDRETTHCLFIDNDLAWNPYDILKLILADKELIGGVYPLKKYDWNRLTNPAFISSVISRKNTSQIKDKLSDEQMIQHNLLHYNTNYLNGQLTIDQNIAKVKHLATGFMMIQRSVLEKLIRTHPATKYTDDVHFLQPHENEMAYALFDCGVREGHYFSEDWLFCDRWSNIGGDIYIDVTINLTHTGVEDYNGSFISSII